MLRLIWSEWLYTSSLANYIHNLFNICSNIGGACFGCVEKDQQSFHRRWPLPISSRHRWNFVFFTYHCIVRANRFTISNLPHAHKLEITSTTVTPLNYSLCNRTFLNTTLSTGLHNTINLSVTVFHSLWWLYSLQHIPHLISHRIISIKMENLNFIFFPGGKHATRKIQM